MHYQLVKLRLNTYSPREGILAIKVEFGTSSRWCHLQSSFSVSWHHCTEKVANLCIWYIVTKPHVGDWYTRHLHGHLNLELIRIWSRLADTTTRQDFNPLTKHLHHNHIMTYVYEMVDRDVSIVWHASPPPLEGGYGFIHTTFWCRNVTFEIRWLHHSPPLSTLLVMLLLMSVNWCTTFYQR